MATPSAAIHPTPTAADELTFDELTAEIQRLWHPQIAARAAEPIAPQIAPPPVAAPPAPAPAPVEVVSAPSRAGEPSPEANPDRRPVPPDADPILLPLCRTDVRIILGDTVAVLNWSTHDGRAILMPVGLDGLDKLAHAVANALAAAIARSL